MDNASGSDPDELSSILSTPSTTMYDKKQWIVTYAGCHEQATVYGTYAEAMQPDDLGCPALHCAPASRYEVEQEPHEKNGVLRVVAEPNYFVKFIGPQ